jgi:G3E family GTPase
MDPEAKVPITLLTGFLGAGKTTRLNATLAAGEVKIAVIENELGALGVDGALVANMHDDGVIELTNGCLCCSAEIDLIGALEALARRRAIRPFEHVVIETTGLADVSPVVSLLRDRDDDLADDFIFNGVITVVDAVGFARWKSAESTQDADAPLTAWASGFGGTSVESMSGTALGPGRTAALRIFWRQLALADCIIVSKADLISEEALQELQGTLPLMNPVASVTIEAGGSAGVIALPIRKNCTLGSEPPKSQRPSSGAKRFCGTRPVLRKSAHLDGIEAISITLPTKQPLRREPLLTFISDLLAGDLAAEGVSMDAWRVKGLVAVAGQGSQLVQGVGDQIELESWPHPLDSDPFLVIIGEGLHRESIEEALLECTDSTLVPELGF